MYFPYLYGRQSEFLAVRDLLNDPRDLSDFIPIFEPINGNASALTRCLNECETHEQPTVVIINPTLHQLADAGVRAAWLGTMSTVLAACPSAIPAFQTSDYTTGANLRAALATFPGRPVAVIHNGAGLSDADVRAAAGNARIDWHIIIDSKLPNRQRALLPVAKMVVVRDGFHKQVRNADYRGQEFFSDLYHTYLPHGGFGDFVCLGAGFQDGGTTPAAVAIHAVYKHPSTGDLWMEHFVSDDTVKGTVDVSTKFVQAARKLRNAAQRRPAEFGTNQALDAYRDCVRNNTFPGLPTNKRYQIIHHFCVVLDALSGAL